MIEVSLNGREVSGRICIPATFTIKGVDIAVNALWDTGAAHSCINKKYVGDNWVADQEAPVYGANDADKTPDEVMRKKYRASITINGLGVKFHDALVASMPIADEAIIGMDIISLLDFTLKDGGKCTISIGSATK